MPRRFRSVRAWRSSKPRKRDGLHPRPEVNKTPEPKRKRYIDAIDSVADYLKDIGADAVWVKRFDELNGAVEDLVKGALQPALTPQYRNLEGEK